MKSINYSYLTRELTKEMGKGAVEHDKHAVRVRVEFVGEKTGLECDLTTLIS